MQQNSQYRSFSLTGPSAAQLSQSVKERFGSGTHSLPKGALDMHVFQHRFVRQIELCWVRSVISNYSSLEWPTETQPKWTMAVYRTHKLMRMSSLNLIRTPCGWNTAAQQLTACQKVTLWKVSPSSRRQVYQETRSWFNRETQLQLHNNSNNKDRTRGSIEAIASGKKQERHLAKTVECNF